MSTFENKIIEGMFSTQFIASYIVASGRSGQRLKPRVFRAWLESLIINGRKLTEIEIRDLMNLMFTGKLELQEHCERFLNELDSNSEKTK